MIPVTHCQCGHTLSPEAQRRPAATGVCRACVLARNLTNPELNARRYAAISRRHRDPAFKARHAETVKQALRVYSATPEGRAERSESGRKGGLKRTGACRLPAGHPVRIKAGAARTAKHFAWCPPQFHDRYRFLRPRIGAPAARAKVMAEFVDDDPFGAKLWAVACGAPVCDNARTKRMGQ
jgi:hypothetical protein